MSDYYFNKFPIIEYNDVTVRDISRNVRLNATSKAVPTLFYPYELEHGLRSDVLAHAYYNDSYLDWLIYITNGIVDPYYGWYMDENQFHDFLAKKYGSVEQAQRLIKHFIMDWNRDEPHITPDFYEDNLAEDLKKYYIPNFGYGAKIISYKRREETWYANTNKILQLTVNTHSNAEFTNTEFLTFYDVLTPIGNGQVITANSTVVTVQHVQGNTSANNLIRGQNSAANATILDTDLVIENITDEEYVYWTPVTMYNFEQTKNEERKYVMLLDANHALDASEELRLKMKED